MPPEVKRPEEVVVGPRDSGQAVVWNRADGQPHEDAMFSNPNRCDEPWQICQSRTHLASRALMQPPAARCRLASFASRLDDAEGVFKRCFVKRGLLFRRIDAEINDPHALSSIHDVFPVEPG